jgi:hypothetical protein
MALGLTDPVLTVDNILRTPLIPIAARFMLRAAPKPGQLGAFCWIEYFHLTRLSALWRPLRLPTSVSKPFGASPNHLTGSNRRPISRNAA